MSTEGERPDFSFLHVAFECFRETLKVFFMETNLQSLSDALLCCFFEQKTRTPKGELSAPLCSPVCYSLLMFHALLLSSKSFGPVPPPPPPIHNVSVQIKVVAVAGFLFCFPLNFCWLVADHTARLIRGDDSVFSPPQLKHYRQTHSFIIWGGKAFFHLNLRGTACSVAAWRHFAVFWDRWSHKYQKAFAPLFSNGWKYD